MKARRSEHIETPRVVEQEVTEEERMLIGDLGNEFDDPDELFAERPDYWRDLAQAHMPTRQALWRHRLAEAWSALRAMGRGRDHLAPQARVPDEVWIRLFEAEVGRTSHEPSAVYGATAEDRFGSPFAEMAGGVRVPDGETSAPPSQGPVRFALDRDRTGLDESVSASERLARKFGATS